MKKYLVCGTATVEIYVEASSSSDAKAIVMDMHRSKVLPWHWDELDVEVDPED